MDFHQQAIEDVARAHIRRSIAVFQESVAQDMANAVTESGCSFSPEYYGLPGDDRGHPSGPEKAKP